MPRPDAQALAGACLPGRGTIELEPIGRGLSSDTYRVRRDGRAFALRLARASGTAADAAAHEFEARLVARAAACGLAPPLVASDAQRGVLALAWVPGHPWDAAAAGAPSRIEAAATLIRRLHALEPPTPLRRCSPRGWADRYRALATPRAVALPDLHPRADAALDALAALGPAPAVVCHSDLHCLNLLEPASGGAPASVLLDWEYAHVSEPGWDLAGWSANNDFTPTQSRALLAAYTSAESGPMPWQRFILLRWLFDYVCVLWIDAYQAAVQSRAPALMARAVLLETRLNAAVCGKLAASDESYSLGDVNGADDRGGSGWQRT